MCNDSDIDIDPSNASLTALIMSKYTSCHFMCITNPMVFFKIYFRFICSCIQAVLVIVAYMLHEVYNAF